MAANSLIIDADALNALRAILVDNDPANYAYTDARLVQALRDNRETVMYRNPMFQTPSVYPFPILMYGRGRTPLNKSNTVESHLHPEPGLRAYQAARYCRHWDSQQPASVYQNGVLKVLTTDYTVDYPEGRVTFVADVQDYEPVTASYCYYKVYHAAKDCLLWRLAKGNALISWTDADASEHYGTVKEALQALSYAIGSMSPSTVARRDRVY